MARKRPSLKDKDVFKRSKDLDALFGAPAKADEADEKEEPIETTPDNELSALAEEASVSVSATVPEPEKDATDETDSPIEPEETPVAVTKSPAEETEVEDVLDFPAAMEMPPSGPLTEDLPVGEIGEFVPEVDDFLDFPAAMASPSSGPPKEDLPSGETGTMSDEANGVLDFPAAMEMPPSGPLTEDLPAGEAGEFVPEVDDFLDFPAAMASPAGGPLEEDLPRDESGNTSTSVGKNDYLNFDSSSPANAEAAVPIEDDFDLLASALAEEAAPAREPESPRPAVSARPIPPAQPIPASLQSASTSSTPTTSSAPETPYVSRDVPLSFSVGAEADELFDLTSIAREPKTIPFEMPADAEDLTEEERKERRQLLNDPRIREQFIQVYNAIDGEYEHILDSNISVSQEITDWAHKLLAETRYIIMNYQVKYLAKAEWNIEQVKARLDRAEESAMQAKKWARWIIIWGMIWFVVFVYFTIKPDLPLTVLSGSTTLPDFLVPDIFLRAQFFGAIGGVAAVFYSLLRYVTKRTFDVEYVLSYFVKPFMGMILGTLVYLLVFVVMQFFDITPSMLESPSTSSELTKRSIFEFLTYFIATVSGFKENLVFDLMRRALKIIFRDTDDTDSEEKAPPAPPGPYSDL